MHGGDPMLLGPGRPLKRIVIGALAVLGLGAVVGVIYAAAGAGGSASSAARERATRGIIGMLAGASRAYTAEHGRAPATLDTLVDARLIERIPTDAWDQPLMYAAPGPRGEKFVIVSAGEDGIRGTDDDIGNNGGVERP